MSRTKKTIAPNENRNEWLFAVGGEKSVDFQKSAQITWWSILQGLAVVALAEKIPPIMTEISQTPTHWYLLIYAVISLMVIVISWVQMAWAILIYRWPINLFHTTLISLLGLSIYLVCLYIDRPISWMISVVFLLISSMLIYAYNIRTRSMMDLPLTHTWVTLGMYFVFILITLSASFHMSLNSDSITFTVWGFIHLIFVILAWLLQTYNMKEEQRLLKVP